MSFGRENIDEEVSVIKGICAQWNNQWNLFKLYADAMKKGVDAND